MQLAVNLDSRAIVSWGGLALESLSMTRNDRVAIELKFIRGSGFIALPVDSRVSVGVKRPGFFNEGVRAIGVAGAVIGSGRKAFYPVDLVLNTVEMNALFTQEPASVDAILEIEIQALNQPAPAQRYLKTAIPIPLVVLNEYLRDGETPPIPVGTVIDLRATKAEAEAGVSNEKWMTPLRTREAILAHSGPSGPSSSMGQMVALAVALG